MKMSIREEYEKKEREFICEYGCLSAESKGRLVDEERCPIRTEFQRDRDRILYSNAFRRLKHKTQVFLSPLGEHYRTRLTHTLEVAQIARSLARAMRLNEDLTEAIALAHDLGHTPFGHSGETALKQIYSIDFSHTSQSLRVVDVLEKDGKGLNLTLEVRDGIIKHSKGYGDVISSNPDDMATTVEGRIVRVADIMAYLNHDLDDAIRSGVITENQVPDLCTRILGNSHAQRATAMVTALIENSGPENGEFILRVSPTVKEAMSLLREFLYENVYRSPQVHGEFEKSMKILKDIYHYFLDTRNCERFELELADIEMENCAVNDPHDRRICDLIASMTDRHALDLYSRLFFPLPLV